MLARTRNLGILAHVDAGKTTLTERILYATGATYKRGEVDDGTTVTDFDPQERDRGITIFSAAVSCSWEGYRINLIDTPGHIDFSDEVERSLRVLDGAIAVLDGVAGVETQTEAVWRQADRYGVPRIAFVNKLDRTGADLDVAVASIRARLHAVPLVVQLPIGRESTLRGVVDLIGLRSLVWPDGGGEVEVGPVPDALRDEALRRRRALEETVAELHPGAMDEFCLTSTVSGSTLTGALRDLTLSGAGLVVLCGSAYHNRGIEPLLDAVTAYLPSPLDVAPVDVTAPFVGLVFKVQAAPTGRLTYIRAYSGTVEKGESLVDAATGRRERVARILRVQADRHTDVERATAGDIVALVGPKAARTGTTLCAPGTTVLLEPPVVAEPLVSVAIEARAAADTDRLATGLAHLVEEDPSLAVRVDTETGQTLLSGLGELHLEVAVERLRRDHAVVVTVGRPQVAYRETITASLRGFVYRHVKQDGGPGQWAHVVLDVEPSDALLLDSAPQASQEFGFSSTVVGGRVPADLVRAVEAGCRDALADGPLGGHPVVGVRVTLTDGATHPKDSSELAFRNAGRFALREALQSLATSGGVVRLEPVVEVTAVVPVDEVGGVLGDLTARRGRIDASTTRAGSAVITATVPLAELFGYASRLRSRTHGRGTFSTRPTGYAPAPARV
jgi:elongation factor G